MIKPLATFGGSDPLSVILGSAEEGWSGAFGMDLLKWNTEGDLDVIPMNWPNYQPRQVGFQGYVQGDFILGSAQPGGCILIGQKDASGFIKTVDDSSGDFADRYSTYTNRGKGMFAATFADPMSLPTPTRAAKCIFDLALRELGKPWYCARVDFPSKFPLGSVALSYRNVYCAVASDGQLNIYGESDSSGELSLLELLVVEGTLVVKNFTETWIPRDQGNPDNPLSPCGEWAQLTVVEDQLNQRTLLAYQQYKDVKMTGSYGQPTFYSRWTFVEHRPGQPPKHLGMTTEWCLHKAGQLVIMVPLSDGAVYVGFPYNDLADPERFRGWRFYTLKECVFKSSSDELPYGDLMAHGPDGAGVFFPREGPGAYLKQLIHVTP